MYNLISCHLSDIYICVFFLKTLCFGFIGQNLKEKLAFKAERIFLRSIDLITQLHVSLLSFCANNITYSS